MLHTLWEFTQCIFLYDMWGWPFMKATLWMWGAVLGDILIVLALWKGITFLFPFISYSAPKSTAYLLLIWLSFFASILLEWVAVAMDLWQYSSEMTTITIMNYEVGLSPILQISILPALSIYLAEKSKGQKSNLIKTS